MSASGRLVNGVNEILGNRRFSGCGESPIRNTSEVAARAGAKRRAGSSSGGDRAGAFRAVFPGLTLTVAADVELLKTATATATIVEPLKTATATATTTASATATASIVEPVRQHRNRTGLTTGSSHTLRISDQ